MRKIYLSLVAEMESPMPQIFQPQYQPEDDSQDQDIIKAEICQARVLCDTSKVLFNLLTRNKACQPPHSAFIRLTGFGQPEIDMIMSLCEAKGASEKWHQVYLTSKIPSNMREIPQPESICSALRDARKFRKLLRIYLQTDGSWKCAVSSASDLMKQYVQPPDLTLEAQLNARRLLKKDKLNLAVAIARSLFHLLGSPFLQGLWNAENIYVTQTANEVVDTKPYIARQLTHRPPNDGPEYSSHGNRVILDLGLLLWQLLFGRKVTVGPEDREDEDEDDLSLSRFNALNREHDNYQEFFVEKPCLDIIENCLNLYSLYQLDHQAFQEKIYWDVVTPLRNYLEFFYQFKKPLPDSNQVGTTFLACATSVKSESKLNRALHISKQTETSLGKGVIVKGKCDITVGQRKVTPRRPTFAESNLLALSSDVR